MKLSLESQITTFLSSLALPVKARTRRCWSVYLGVVELGVFERHLVSTGSKTSEQSRLAAAREKRATRKARSASTSTAVTDYKCSTCGRYFRAQIGLVSHLWTHRNQSTMLKEVMVLIVQRWTNTNLSINVSSVFDDSEVAESLRHHFLRVWTLSCAQ